MGLFLWPFNPLFKGVFFYRTVEKFVFSFYFTLEKIAVDLFIKRFWEFEADTDIGFFHGFERGWSGFGVIVCDNRFILRFRFWDKLFPFVYLGSFFDERAYVFCEFSHE